MTTAQILLLVLVFVAVAGGVAGIGVAFTRGAGIRARLRQLVGGAPSLEKQAAPQSEWAQTLVKMAEPVARLATPTEEDKVSMLKARFMHAGFRQPAAPVLFFALKAVLVVGLPMLFVLGQQAMNRPIEGNMGMAMLLLFAAIGYYLPNGLLDWATRRRQRDIFEAFPDAIDLMIVCVEAGLGLDMAINRAAEEIRLRSSNLADELDMIALELRVGSSRERALRNFAMRTGLDEVSTFVTMLLQADRFGTSMAESLRVHADSLRTRRRLQAEEAAAKIPLKLLFPLIFFIFPSLLLVLMGPAMIQIYRIMLPTLGGGGG